MPIEKEISDQLPAGWELRRSFPDEKGNCRWMLEKVSPVMSIERKAEYQEKPTIEILNRAIASYRGG